MLDVARLSDLLVSAWALPEPLEIAPMPVQGHSSETWSVCAGGESFVAKLIHDGPRSAEPGLRVAAAVEAGGVPTGAPAQTLRGDVHVAITAGEREWTLALLRFAPGRMLEPGSSEAAEVAGDLLGRVHAVLLTESERSWVPADLLDWCEGRVGGSVALSSIRALQRRGQLACAVVYGDPSPEVLVDDASGTVALIDWGTPSWGPLLHDVACWSRFFGAGRAERLLEAYRRVMPLEEAEVAALRLFHELHRELGIAAPT